MRERTKKIRQFILDNVKDHPKDIAAFTAKKFDISHQAVNKHKNGLIIENRLTAKGVRNKREYYLANMIVFSRIYKVINSGGKKEDTFYDSGYVDGVSVVLVLNKNNINKVGEVFDR